MKLRHPHWARREIARLDPVADARRIAHLVFEVRYGSPLFVHPLFALAFARQVAVPAIARVLYRDGKGIILSDTAKRNDDTLVFFGLLFRHGNSPAGREVVDRIVRIHSRFPIPNDLNLYTLSTLACLPTRIGREFVGRDLIGPREQLAMYEFWREVGEMMGIHDIPGSAEKMLRWSIDYERAEYATTKDGVEVTAALAREFAQRWFPAPLRARGERVFYALFDDHLRQTHGIAPPTAAERRMVLAAVRGFVRAVELLPDPAERDLVGMFGRRYRGKVTPEAVGPQG